MAESRGGNMRTPWEATPCRSASAIISASTEASSGITPAATSREKTFCFNNSNGTSNELPMVISPMSCREEGSSLKSAAYSRAEEGRRRISLENSAARLKFSGEHDTYPTRVGPGSVTVPTAFVGAVIKCVFHNQADVKISVLRSQPDGRIR